MAEVKLYRSEKPFWLVDARCGPKNGLSICSGDASAEWYTKVAPQHLDRLLAALRQHLGKPVDGESGVSKEQEILNLLMLAFGVRDSNPYTPISEFLNQSGIPVKNEFWGSI